MRNTRASLPPSHLALCLSQRKRLRLLHQLGNLVAPRAQIGPLIGGVIGGSILVFYLTCIGKKYFTKGRQKRSLSLHQQDDTRTVVDAPDLEADNRDALEMVSMTPKNGDGPVMTRLFGSVEDSYSGMVGGDAGLTTAATPEEDEALAQLERRHSAIHDEALAEVSDEALKSMSNPLFQSARSSMILRKSITDVSYGVSSRIGGASVMRDKVVIVQTLELGKNCKASLAAQFEAQALDEGEDGILDNAQIVVTDFLQENLPRNIGRKLHRLLNSQDAKEDSIAIRDAISDAFQTTDVALLKMLKKRNENYQDQGDKGNRVGSSAASVLFMEGNVFLKCSK